MAYHNTHKNLRGIFMKRANKPGARFQGDVINQITRCPSTGKDGMIGFDVMCVNKLRCVHAEAILYGDSNIWEILFGEDGPRLRNESLLSRDKYKFFIEKYYDTIPKQVG